MELLKRHWADPFIIGYVGGLTVGALIFKSIFLTSTSTVFDLELDVQDNLKLKWSNSPSFRTPLRFPCSARWASNSSLFKTYERSSLFTLEVHSRFTEGGKWEKGMSDFGTSLSYSQLIGSYSLSWKEGTIIIQPII